MQSPVRFGGLRHTGAEQGLPSWRPHSSKALAHCCCSGARPLACAFSTGFREILKEQGNKSGSFLGPEPGCTAQAGGPKSLSKALVSHWSSRKRAALVPASASVLHSASDRTRSVFPHFPSLAESRLLLWMDVTHCLL